MPNPLSQKGSVKNNASSTTKSPSSKGKTSINSDTGTNYTSLMAFYGQLRILQMDKLCFIIGLQKIQKKTQMMLECDRQ